MTTRQGGIVVAVDSRATLGNFIGSKTVQKVLPIHPRLLGTMAGGAADCSFWIRKLAAQAALYKAQHPQGKQMSVARASRFLSNAMYLNQGLRLSVGSMIMGYDDDDDDDGMTINSQPRLFYVGDTGARIEGDMFAVGSGSTYAVAVLDRHFQQQSLPYHNSNHDDDSSHHMDGTPQSRSLLSSSTTSYRMSPLFTKEQAIRLAVEAIRYATFRDGSSGGFINVYHMGPQDKAFEHVFRRDVAAIVPNTTTTTTTTRTTTNV